MLVEWTVTVAAGVVVLPPPVETVPLPPLLPQALNTRAAPAPAASMMDRFELLVTSEPPAGFAHCHLARDRPGFGSVRCRRLARVEVQGKAVHAVAVAGRRLRRIVEDMAEV